MNWSQFANILKKIEEEYFQLIIMFCGTSLSNSCFDNVSYNLVYVIMSGRPYLKFRKPKKNEQARLTTIFGIFANLGICKS